MTDKPTSGDPPERVKKWTARPSPFALLPFAPWPAGLPRTSDDPVYPLQIGIFDELALMLPDESHWAALRTALGWHCSTAAYLRAVSADGAQRHAVDGHPVAPVSDLDKLTGAIRLLAMSLRRATPEHAAQAKPLLEKAKVVAKVIAPAPDQRPSGTPQNAVHEAPAGEMAVLGPPGAPQRPIKGEGYGGRPVISLRRA
jgi:sRNA-binding protein